jgi:hypothetical protein
MLTVLGGSVCGYVAGGALMLAECSLWTLVRACGADGCGDGQRDLAVLALPDKIGLAPAAAHLILLEAADGDKVGVCFATRRALHLECVEEGRVLGV